MLSYFCRCSDGADRLREHWDQNECHLNNVTSLEQCAIAHESDHTEWRNSMVKDPVQANLDEGSTSGSAAGTGSTASIVSAVISTILVLVLLGLVSGYLYVYGRRNPGGWAERLSQRLEAPYKRFGILDESKNETNENNNTVEMAGNPAKFSENNNTETAISF